MGAIEGLTSQRLEPETEQEYESGGLSTVPPDPAVSNLLGPLPLPQPVSVAVCSAPPAEG